MRRSTGSVLAALALFAFSMATYAKPAQQYLPADANLDPSIPTPESVLGWNVGDWHVSHDKLLHYMQTLAAASPRVTLKETGRTYEQRPLLLLTITSEENHQQVDALRQQHLDGDGPLVVWLGYSVHGNEPSGSNAALLVAYYLAASKSEFVTQLLKDSVVLLDPSVNPDGLQRFANWANHNAGRVPVTDPNTRQHNENWVSGRTNHYWFDLNRDWLPLVHPESRARIVEFHRWLPHVLTDHHEQGGYPGFFFQPGIPSRQNPLTPDENLELTRELAKYHAAALDKVGQPHFAEDAFDDFYYGKGSTYPDINGGIGILFEQKAIGGQALETSNGIETFPQSISNQLAMSLSTLQGSWEIRDLLKSYQSEFHDNMMRRVDRRDFNSWVVADGGDPARAKAFLDILNLHGIEYHTLGQTVRANNREFRPGHAWVIPARQRQFGLLEAIMETRTRFQDSTFYDVSAWTLPLAFNLPYATLSNVPSASESSPVPLPPPMRGAVAWAIPWNQLQAPPLLQNLLDAGARVRTAIKPFSAETASGLTPYSRGTLLVQSGIQEQQKSDSIFNLLVQAANNGLRVDSLSSATTATGPDLGTKHFRLVEPIKPLIIGGKGTSAYGVGEVWFQLDYRLGVPAPMVEIPSLGSIDLNEYTHLLLADGDYDAINDASRTRIKNWVRAGGVLLTIARAAEWAETLCFKTPATDCKPGEEKAQINGDEEAVAPRAYEDFDDDRARMVIGGAIVSALADLSHPMMFGYKQSEIPIFRRGTVELSPSDNAYATPVRYSNEPLLAGYIGEERLDSMKGQAAVIAERKGKGLVVSFANTPIFRGFWRGTERMFVNALYFGQVVDATTIPK